MPQQRNTAGKFIQTRDEWTVESWNDGYIDNRGRFRVYCPSCPRAYSNGYALRAHVVWWLAKGRVHPRETVLHHKNEDKLDDELSNLQVKRHGKHTADHHRKAGVTHKCSHCRKKFVVPAWRVRQRKREGSEIRFCGQTCYHEHKRTLAHSKAIGTSLRKAYREGRR